MTSILSGLIVGFLVLALTHSSSLALTAGILASMFPYAKT